MGVAEGGVYSIGDAARSVGVSAGTIRGWEREGLISIARSKPGYRQLSEDDITRLRRIRYMRNVQRLNVAAIKRELMTDSPVVAGGSDQLRSLGGKLRSIRLASGLTLREVGTKTGISVSFLSAVERGLHGASVSTLQRLLSAYGVTFDALMERHPESDEKLVRAHRRARFAQGTGVVIENLARKNVLMQPQFFRVEPGAGSEGAYAHEGEEFVYVLAGTFDVWLDEVEHYHLDPDDCLYFRSTQVHRWQNAGREPATLLWVNTPPTF